MNKNQSVNNKRRDIATVIAEHICVPTVVKLGGRWKNSDIRQTFENGYRVFDPNTETAVRV